MHPNKQSLAVPGLWFICPCVCITCFVLRILCIVIWGGDRHLGYVPLGVRGYRRVQMTMQKGAGYCTSTKT